MKSNRAGILLLALFFSLAATAQPYKMAVGARFSTEDAAISHSISLKYFFSQKTAVEALLSLPSPMGIGLLVERHDSLSNSGFAWIYGAGGYVGFGGTRKVGLQGILGMDYKVP